MINIFVMDKRLVIYILSGFCIKTWAMRLVYFVSKCVFAWIYLELGFSMTGSFNMTFSLYAFGLL